MDDFTESWLNVEKNLGGARPVLRGTAEEMRTQFNGLCALLAAQRTPPSDNVVVQDGREGDVSYRTYKPRACDGQAAPVGVFYHCGGFVTGDLDTEDFLCRNVALLNSMVVISVDYRLAPENKAPTQLEDAIALCEWTYKNVSKIGGDPSRMFAIGSSAGASLALAITRKVVLGSSALPKDTIKGVIALCPLTLHPDYVPAEYKALYTSYEENKENVPIVDKVSMMQLFENVQANPNDEQLFTALDKTFMRLFPPTYIVTTSNDILRDDGQVLLKALSSAGVTTRTDHYGGLPHCFWLFPSLPETDLFMDNVNSAIAWMTGQ